MTYLYHRWEQVFGKDGLDLLLWIMILLILRDSIASWAGAAKITTHQATTVTLQVFYKEKLENSGKTKTPKGDKYEEKLPGPVFAITSTQDFPYVQQGSKPWPCPGALVCVHGSSCTMTRVTLAHLSLSPSPTGPQWAGCFSWARP